MWWLFAWKMGLAIAATVILVHYAVETDKTVREAYHAWQAARTAPERGENR